MKYSHAIIIELPREEVIKLFDNEENMFKWMRGLESVEHLSGDKGMEGAKMELRFNNGKRTMGMVETIIKRNLPDHISFLYEAKGVQNWNDNHFEAIEENQTKWTQNNVFKFKGMVWFFALLMPGMFKKQSLRYMFDFKKFAEAEAAQTAG
ncbi:MAG: SRPBCC family protein [Crocinitomicaceae bacterium]|nr:SRPBCC family protein [Crocinitomicaceae bacterium]